MLIIYKALYLEQREFMYFTTKKSALVVFKIEVLYLTLYNQAPLRKGPTNVNEKQILSRKNIPENLYFI